MTEQIPDPDPEVTANLERHYVRQIDRIARQLRDTADRIERYREIRRNVRDLKPDYLGSSSDVIHTLQSFWMNVPLDTLTHSAAEVHVYVRVGDVSA